MDAGQETRLRTSSAIAEARTVGYEAPLGDEVARCLFHAVVSVDCHAGVDDPTFAENLDEDLEGLICLVLGVGEAVEVERRCHGPAAVDALGE